MEVEIKYLGNGNARDFPILRGENWRRWLAATWAPRMWICAGDHEVHLCHQARLLGHLWVIVPDGIVVLSSAGNIQRSWPEPQRQGVAGGSPGRWRGGAAKQWHGALMARTGGCGRDSDWGWDEPAVGFVTGCGVWELCRNSRRDLELCCDGDGTQRARWWL